MSIKDAYGNELHEGDFVLVHINKVIRMRIAKIEEPGSLTVPNGDANKQLGYIATQWTAIDPIAKGQEKVMTLFKTTDPALQQAVEDIAKDIPRGPIPIPRKQ